MYGGLTFVGFYINCNSKDFKTYELKLVNPLSKSLLQKENTTELINIYNLTDTHVTSVYHVKGSNNEKIEQKYQKFMDSYVMITSNLRISFSLEFKPDDFIKNLNEFCLQKAKNLENSSIITINDILIMNEQESLDYYVRNITSQPLIFNFNEENQKNSFPNSQNVLTTESEINLEAFVNKKACINDCKKVTYI